MTLPKGWRKYKSSKMVFNFADYFYQKTIYQKGETEISANIVEYTLKDKKSYELVIYIPEEVCIVKNWIKLSCYSYSKLNFLKIENDAKKIIKQLIK